MTLSVYIVSWEHYQWSSMCWLPQFPSSLLQGQYICVCQQCLILQYPQNGVLQGSILGVTLHTAAINEIVNTVGLPVEVPASVTNITCYCFQQPCRNWMTAPAHWKSCRTGPSSHTARLSECYSVMGVCSLPCISTFVHLYLYLYSTSQNWLLWLMGLI